MTVMVMFVMLMAGTALVMVMVMIVVIVAGALLFMLMVMVVMVVVLAFMGIDTPLAVLPRDSCGHALQPVLQRLQLRAEDDTSDADLLRILKKDIRVNIACNSHSSNSNKINT